MAELWIGIEWDHQGLTPVARELLAEVGDSGHPGPYRVVAVGPAGAWPGDEAMAWPADWEAEAYWAVEANAAEAFFRELAITGAPTADGVIVAGTPEGQRRARWLAARMGRDLVPEAEAIRWRAGGWAVSTHLAGGRVRAEVTVPAGTVIGWRPMARGTAPKPGAHPARPVPWRRFEPRPAPPPAGRLLERTAASSRDRELEEAAVVVAGGRGLGGSAGFEPLFALAERLGGAVGATRVAVDRGWVAYARQIGSTGKTVSPRLYIACAISGAAQHVAGLRDVRHLVAINLDPTAPIMAMADLALVGEAEAVVRQAVAVMDARRAEGGTRDGAQV
ncbi:MAG: FAD-binding protein [Firmicutes bacterium]|nr:electron transfer flavoprotein subunit alpha/FixB family protein [Alicyclobacillaceae bacterium]MCL6497529.1 FAD-binding protein [Bacillota bacterium]